MSGALQVVRLRLDPSGVGQAGKAQDDGRWARGELKLQEEIDEDGEKIDNRDYKHTESKR